MTTPGKLVSIVLLVSFGIVSCTATRPTKCCPPGYIFSGTSWVNCTPTPENAMELYGAGVESHGVPTCEHPDDIATNEISKITTESFVQHPVCFEILYVPNLDVNRPIFVHCRSNRGRDENGGKDERAMPPYMLDVKRCCPRNKFFDRTTKTCVSMTDANRDANYSDVDDFMSLMPRELNAIDFLSVSRGLPKCTEAIFDYEVNVDDISFENQTLRVKLPSPDGKFETHTVDGENTCFEVIPGSRSIRKLAVRVCRSAELCQNNTCIRKCCSEDEFYFFSTGCRKLTVPETKLGFHETVLNVTNGGNKNSREYGLLVGSLCKFDMYTLRPDEEWTLTPEGYLQILDYETYEHSQYCMDMLFNNSEYEESLYPLICFQDPSKEQEATETRYKVNTILEATSCFFLLLTLLVYACLPVLQNLHGKTLMCHAASLFVAYGCLAIMPWVTPESFYWETAEEESATTFCVVLGYVMLFSFLSAFFWLNVMCFDIWRTFGGLRGGTTRGRAHKKRFLLYSLYAWGMPLFMTVFGILSDQMEILPEFMRPNIGLASCWFTQLPDLYGELVFFIGPIMIQLIVNVVFFILTSVHCSKVKAEIRRVADPSDPRSKRFHADKTKLIMNIKLFVVMGVSWIAEIISFFLNKYAKGSQWKEEVFYASDALNCLQGLLIFILFVLKTRVFVALKRRLGFEQKKSVASQATTALQDPYRVKKSASSSTLTSTFTVSAAP